MLRYPTNIAAHLQKYDAIDHTFIELGSSLSMPNKTVECMRLGIGTRAPIVPLRILNPNKKHELLQNVAANYRIDKQWHRAKECKYMALQDPLLTYLDYIKVETRKRKTDTKLSRLSERGIKHEFEVIERLKKKFDVLTICEKKEDAFDWRFAAKTKIAMRQKIPLIYQGALHDAEKKAFGVPDLIVRCDMLDQLFGPWSKCLPLDDKCLNYCIVDIKSCTLPFKKDGITLCNQPNIKACKAQVGFYNRLLTSYQAVDVGFAVLMGHNAQPGLVDLLEEDAWVETICDDAMRWKKEIITSGSLCHDPPNHAYLYPNMCNALDAPHRATKNALATKNKEITLLWRCGIDARKKAHDAGLYTYDVCTSELLGNPHVEPIIKVNTTSTTLDVGSFTPPNLDGALYVDFETVNSIMCDDADNEIVFLAGVGQVIDGEWTYTSFLANDTRRRTIRNVLERFMEIASSAPLVIHWSPFEPCALRRACQIYDLDMPDIKWYDMCKAVQSGGVAVKGAFNYSLKSIAKALYDNGLIKTTWSEDVNLGGLGAMELAGKAYSMLQGEERREALDRIVSYNEVDCKVMYETMSALQDAH